MSNLRRCVLTGGPGVGKSTLLDELSNRGIAVVPEVARAILKAPGGMQLRAEKPKAFAQAMFEGELAAFEQAKIRGGLTIFYRGFADSAAFLALEGCDPLPSLENAGHNLRYEGPIFRLPPWREIYRTDGQRNQSWEEALASDLAISSAWKRFDYDLSDVPIGPVTERANWLCNQIATL